MPKPRTRVWVARTMVAGPLIALFPISLWSIFSIGCTNAFDESACGGAVFLWFLLPSKPEGLLVFAVGLVVWIVIRLRSSSLYLVGRVLPLQGILDGSKSES